MIIFSLYKECFFQILVDMFQWSPRQINGKLVLCFIPLGVNHLQTFHRKVLLRFFLRFANLCSLGLSVFSSTFLVLRCKLYWLFFKFQDLSKDMNKLNGGSDKKTVLHACEELRWVGNEKGIILWHCLPSKPITLIFRGYKLPILFRA